MRLLGGMLITKIQIAAMERVDIPEKDRVDFYLYVDEFQNFAVDSFASILSEARKYRLNLIMAHQYIAQLDNNGSTAVRDAVFGNVGTIITFRVGSPDAIFMENEFMPRFLPDDLINLPKYGIYLKLMIDGVSSQPFSAFTLPAISQKTDSSQKIIEQSRERYAGNREQIEERVSVWSGFGADVDVEKMIKDVTQAKKDAKKARFSFEYTCTRCSKTFTLPIELDKSRPIYCEECKPVIDAERQKSKDKGGKRYDVLPPAASLPAPKVVDGTFVEKPIVAAPASLETLKPPAPVIAPRPAPVPVRIAQPAQPSPVGLTDSQKKRRRRKKKPDGAPAAVPVVYPISVPHPTPPTTSAVPTATVAPKPVLPGERISFGE
jgi:hypothetical protein